MGKRHKYTKEEEAFIVENYLKMPTEEIGRRIGLSSEAITNKANRLRDKGADISGRSMFSKEQDDYIIENKGKKSHQEIALALGLVVTQIDSRVQRLRGKGVVFEKAIDPMYIEPMVTTDGYDTVPWHMRQSTRSQRLTLDWEPDRMVE